MNKIITGLVFMMSIMTTVNAQVGIGTNSPDASAALDITSTDKGLLIPRMSTAQRTTITNPATSLMVFDTDTNSYWSYVEDAWVEDKPGVGKFVDGATANIASYPDKVGIGSNTVAPSHQLYVKGVRDNEDINTAARFDAIYEGSGTSPVTYGLTSYAINRSTATIDYAISTQGITRNNSGGTMNVGVGSWPQLYNSGNISFGYGSISEIYNQAGLIETAVGGNLGINNSAGAAIGSVTLGSLFMANNGTVTNAAGLYIDGEGNGSVSENAYALYIATPFSNVAGDNYALFAENTADSYFAGNVGIGELEPQQKVHIDGVIRLEPQAAAPAGGLGDLYVNQDGNIYFHNGTEWRAVQLAP